jgi:hypothetical protein
MSGQFLTVRFLRLPAAVKGPRTRWVIELSFYGKGHNRASLTARCLDNGKSVQLLDGRAALTERDAACGFRVQIGTIECRIVSAAVAQGVAEFVANSPS